jgi:hypothetical protein
MAEADNANTTLTLKQRFLKELREYVIISIYLWICLSAILWYKASILQAEQVAFLPLGIAAVKALICAKFILIGKAAKLGTRLTSGTVVHKIMWKSLAFFVLLIVFTIIEELILGVIHGETAAKALDHFLSRSWLQTVAPAVLILLVLIPMISFEEIDKAMGEGKLRQTLFGRSEGG